MSRPSRMTTIRSLMASTSGMSELMRMIAIPSCGELIDHLVDLGLRADVDAAGRLVEDQHAGSGVQPLAEDDLLLVAARQRRRPVP